MPTLPTTPTLLLLLAQSGEVAESLAPGFVRFQEKGLAFLHFLPILGVGLLLLGITIVLTIWIGRPSFPYDRLTTNAFANNLVRHLVRIVVLLTGTLLALEFMGASALVGAVLGTAGLTGLAVGFAFRDIVENYLAGVLLSLRQPFAPQDLVEVSGHEGRVVRLTGRETILMTLEGNHVRIPNSTVFKSVMTNFTRNPRRRLTIRVGVAPWVDLTSALTLGRELLMAFPGVLETPTPSARVQELGDSSVELRFSAWVNQKETDFGKARSEATRLLKEAFEDAGIDTPPPEFGVRILADSPGEPPSDTASPSSSDTLQPWGPASGPPRGVPSPQSRSPQDRPPPDVRSSPGDAVRIPEEPRPPVEELELSPDTSIEEEIARELEATPDEPNLLDKEKDLRRS